LVRDLGLSSGVPAPASLSRFWPSHRAVGLPRLLRRFSLASVRGGVCGDRAALGPVARERSAPLLIGLQLCTRSASASFWAPPSRRCSGWCRCGCAPPDRPLFSALVFGLGNAAGYALSARARSLRSAAPLYARAAAVEVLPLLLLASSSFYEKTSA